MYLHIIKGLTLMFIMSNNQHHAVTLECLPNSKNYCTRASIKLNWHLLIEHIALSVSVGGTDNVPS